jgi:hypothetical protein
MLKCVDVAVLSVTLMCPVTLYASERAVSGYEYLTSSHVTQR